MSDECVCGWGLYAAPVFKKGRGLVQGRHQMRVECAPPDSALLSEQPAARSPKFERANGSYILDQQIQPRQRCAKYKHNKD